MPTTPEAMIIELMAAAQTSEARSDNNQTGEERLVHYREHGLQSPSNDALGVVIQAQRMLADAENEIAAGCIHGGQRITQEETDDLWMIVCCALQTIAYMTGRETGNELFSVYEELGEVQMEKYC